MPSLNMNLSVILICSFNLLLALGCLWILPAVWNLRKALKSTALNLNEWADAAEKALHPTPAALQQLTMTIRKSRLTLTQVQTQIRFWQGLWQIVGWIRARKS